MEKLNQLFHVLLTICFIIGCLFILWFLIIILQFAREAFTVWIDRLNKKYPEPLHNSPEKDKTKS